MPDHDDQQDKAPELNDTITTIQENEQTLTLDGRLYRISELPPAAIEVLNDLIRCENEAAEPRFRLRQLSYAQQALTAALGQLITTAGIQPMSMADEDPSTENDPS
jgi:hypothetical protein